MTGRPLCIVRIYLRRRTDKRRPGIMGWFFRPSISRYLAEQALKSGVVYATVTLGHLGFVQGAKRVDQDITEIPPDTLPTCVELVAPKGVLEAFIASQKEDLKDATIVMLEGVEVAVSDIDHRTIPS